MDIWQIGYDICEFDNVRGLGIDINGRVQFDNRDRFAIWMGNIGKATEPCQQTSGCWHLTFDSFLNLHGRWYDYEIFIASCTDNKYGLENERWLLDMIDHMGIYGARVVEGLSAFTVGLVDYVPIIVSSWNFQELLPMAEVMYKQKVKFQGHRVHDPFSRFRTVTPVWIHIWRRNDAHRLMLLRRGALLFYKIIRQIAKSRG